LNTPLLIRRVAAILVAAWLVAVPSLTAQDASPYVSLQHWTMPYVEHLIARGVIPDPTPLTRPLRRADLVRVLREVDTVTVSENVAKTVRRLLAALEPRERGTRYRVDGEVGIAAATYSRRDPLAAIDDSGPRETGGKHGTVNGGLDIAFQFGRVVAVTHPYFDTRLKYDPDWFGRKNRAIAGRTAESYVAAQWPAGEVFFGRMDRNWGPSGIQGLLLSDNPYGLDHLALAFGTRNLQLQAIATQLNDSTDSTGAVSHRYMEQHRVWFRPNAHWAFALWEGSVIGGPNRTFEPWYLNVMNLGYLEQLNTNTEVNSFLGLDVERHGSVTLFGQFMLDDIQVDRKTAKDLKPSSYGLTVGAKGGLGVAALGWTAYYTRVTNLTYRNLDNLEIPLYHQVGTGRNFDDYDQATLQLGFIPLAGLLMQPEITLLRQGEGDPRLPHPPVSAYPTTPTIFQGVVERTLRVALSSSYAPSERVGLTAGAGLHHVTNFQHIAGDTRTRFVGSVALSYRFGREGALP
jgi:capsule assembly protein Wzi